MPNQELPLSPLSLAILLALAGGQLHGYGIMRAVQEQSGVRAGAGSLYAALDRMVRSGLLDERSAPDGQRLFVITRAGRALARAELERLAGVLRQARKQKLLAEGA